jgi:SAM-dependent methyltransferase
MSFPHHDPNWTEAASFLQAHVRNGESILAPDIFWWMFDKIFRYLNTFREPDRGYDFVVVHKGEIAQMNPAVLRRAVASGRCVFGNPVFVIWSSRNDLTEVPSQSDHLAAFHQRLSAITPEDCAAGRAKVNSDETDLSDPGVITKFETLDAATLKTAMNLFWQRGGYSYPTVRDKTYYAEIDRHIRYFGRDWAGLRILDLACGAGRLPNSIIMANSIVGADIAEVAIQRARKAYPSARYAVTDAGTLSFANATFSAVLFIDAIEHVRGAPAVLSEIARVLQPGGELIATVANRNSLHEIIARKLGFPEFKSNYQHIREFTVDEIRSLLTDCGLSIAEAKGILLYPFWGVPYLDDAVRTITDEDPEMVEILRILGERAGPEFAYAFTVRAVKNSQ